MEFKMLVAFPILTFHHQNFTRYHVHLVRHHHFLRKQLLTALLQNHIKQILKRCKTLVLLAYDRKNTLLSSNSA